MKEDEEIIVKLESPISAHLSFDEKSVYFSKYYIGGSISSLSFEEIEKIYLAIKKYTK